jgi:hypothetical protein
MKKQSGKIIYSPSDLIRYAASPYSSWMDRFYLDRQRQGAYCRADQQYLRRLPRDTGKAEVVTVTVDTVAGVQNGTATGKNPICGQHCSLNSWIQTALSSSRNALSFSSARTMNRLPSSRCASAIQMVPPSESTAEIQPKVNPLC